MIDPTEDRRRIADQVVFLNGDVSKDHDIPIVVERPRGIQLTLAGDRAIRTRGRGDVIGVVVFDTSTRKALVGISLEGLPTLIASHFADPAAQTLKIYIVANDKQQLSEYLDRLEWHEVVSNIRTSSNCFVIGPENASVFSEMRCDSFGEITLRYWDFRDCQFHERRVTNA